MPTKIKGFTLIELLVVVAIIGILAAVGVVAYSGYTSGAKKAKAKADHKSLVKFIAHGTVKCEIGEPFNLKLSSGGLNYSEVDRCDLVNSKNGNQLTTRIVHHFTVETYFEKWCMIDGKRSGGGASCQEAVASGGTFGLGGALFEHEIHNCANPNISDCGTLVIETKISNTEYIKNTIKF